MSQMIQQALRWQKPSSSSDSFERWSGWARSLAERHGQVSLRHGVVTMTLLRSFTTLYLLCQRGQNNVWKVFPQIKLAIAPILRESIWRKIGFQNDLARNQNDDGRGYKDEREQWKHSIVLQRDDVTQGHPRSFGIQTIFLNQSGAAIHDRNVSTGGEVFRGKESLWSLSSPPSSAGPGSLICHATDNCYISRDRQL